MPEWFRTYASDVQLMGEPQFSKLFERSLQTTVSKDTSVQWRGDYASVPSTAEEAMRQFGCEGEPWRVNKFVVSDTGRTRRVQLDVFRSNGKPWREIAEAVGVVGIALDKIQRPSNEDQVDIVTLCDLHYGASIKQNGLVNAYSPEILATYLSEMATQINDAGKPIALTILGDLIESFTGLNHKDSWKQITSYGIEAVKGVFLLVCDFLEALTVPVKGIYMVSGNHDRVTEGRDGDTEGEVSSLMYFLLEQRYPSLTLYNPVRLSFKVNNVAVIIGHGHNAWSRRNMGDIITDFSCDSSAPHHVIIQGHLHTATSSGRQLHPSGGVINESRTGTHLTSPSLFTGNDFSDRLGLYGNPGYFRISPQVGRSPEYIRKSLTFPSQ